jgi:hypothetical protein
MSQRCAFFAVGVILLALGAYAVFHDSAHGQPVLQKQRTQWEYQVVEESAQQNRVKGIRDALVRRGLDGWEVCGVSSNISAQGNVDTFYVILKRPTQ